MKMIFSVLLMLCANVQAATYYFSDCLAPYADAACAGNEGNDSYDGLAPAFVSGINGPKRTLTQSFINSRAAGPSSVLCLSGRETLARMTMDHLPSPLQHQLVSESTKENYHVKY